jgi:hypothetical protein
MVMSITSGRVVFATLGVVVASDVVALVTVGAGSVGGATVGSERVRDAGSLDDSVSTDGATDGSSSSLPAHEATINATKPHTTNRRIIPPSVRCSLRRDVPYGAVGFDGISASSGFPAGV